MIICAGKQAYRFPRPVKAQVPFRLADNQHVLVLPIGDVHFGAPGFPAARLARHIAWGLERGAYFLGMGDMMDFTSDSQRALLAQLRNSAKATLDDLGALQVEQLHEVLAPSGGRWLGMLAGNHTHVFQDGTCSEQRLAGLLGTHYLGDLGMVLLELGVERVPIWVLAHHGLGGGRLIGSGLLRLEDMPKAFPQADICLMAHIHSKVSAPLACCYVTPAGVVYHRTKWLARTGSWQRGYLGQAPQPVGAPAMRSEGSYIERGMRQPAALGGLAFGIGYKWDAGAGLHVPDIHASV